MALLALLLAAGAGAAQPAPVAPEGGKVVSPVVVPGPGRTAPPADATIQVSGDSDILGQGVSIWPVGARERGINGHVTLACKIDVHGLAETCTVAYEDPPGWGFGKAALALRPTFRLTPRQGDDGPEASTMNIAVSFRGAAAVQSNLQHQLQVAMTSPADLGSSMTTRQANPAVNAGNLVVRHNPLAMRGVTMLDWPAWARAPGFDDLGRVYPAEARGAEGYVVVHCKVQKTGGLEHCAVAKEQPTGKGFGRAALALAPSFQIAAETMAQAPKGAPVEVDVPIRFAPPAETAERTVRAPVWMDGSDPASIAREIPPEAHARPGSPGALVKCQVGADGALTGCAIELTSPDGIDFDEAAVKLVSRLRMNLWSAEAGPVEGGIVHVPVRLGLGEETQAAR